MLSGTAYTRLKAFAFAILEWQGIVFEIFYLMEVYGLAYNLVFCLKSLSDHVQGFQAVIMVVADQFLISFNRGSYLPAAVYHIKTIYQYLNVIARRGCKRKLECLIIGIAKLVILQVCPLAVHGKGIFKVSAVMLHHFSRLIKGIAFPLKLTPCPSRYFSVSRQGKV